ncbi:MAG: hypothetical protein KF709_01185 [Gemmatimonadaceae bacterium]|nr:hypothetical protein [Gemmatimonadaceae bacterium]
MAGAEVAPHDFASLAVVIFALTRRLRPSVLYGPASAMVAVVGAFTLWTLAALLWSSSATAVEFLFTQLRFFLVYVAVLAFASTEDDPLLSISRGLWRATVGVAVVALALYLWSLATGTTTVSLGPFRDVRIGVFRHLGAPRALGLAHDPNFFSLWLAPGLLIGMSGRVASGFSRIAGLAVISTMILLALSRTVLVAVPVALAVSVLSYAVFSNEPVRLRRRALARLGMSALLLVSVLAGIAAASSTLRTLVQSRFESGAQTRVGRLQVIADHVSPTDLVIGLGPRGAQQLLWGRYSHNTYVDVLVEFGIPGLGLWLAALAFAVIAFLKGLRQRVLLTPWPGIMVVAGAMLMTFSLLTHPMLGVLLAISTLAVSPPLHLGAMPSGGA